mgnify:CR=1 FL=1
MNRFGCGKYTEDQWVDYLFTRDGSAALDAHRRRCPACQAELEGLLSTAAQLKQLRADDENVRVAFVAGVMADHNLSLESRPLTRSASVRKQPTGPLRLSPLLGGFGAVAFTVLLVLLFWQQGNVPLEPETNQLFVATADVMMAQADSEADPVPSPIVIPHGVTRSQEAEAPQAAETPAAKPVRSPSGITLTVVSVSF